MHGIAYNAEDDEIIVPNPVAAAILVFRGGASGAEPPIRVIQGPSTKMVYPHSVNLDAKNKEIIVGDPGGRKVLVFPLKAQGDVAPLRTIQGQKTKLGYVVGLAVDTKRDLLVISSSPIGNTFDGGGAQRGLFVFNRLDNGNVAPKAVIGGPRTGMLEGVWQLQVDSESGKIFVAVGNVIDYRPRYARTVLRESAKRGTLHSPWGSERLGFVAVWDITDSGDVPPRAIIQGAMSGLVHPQGLALNLRDQELFVTDSARNMTFTFSAPEFFGRRAVK